MPQDRTLAPMKPRAEFPATRDRIMAASRNPNPSLPLANPQKVRQYTAKSASKGWRPQVGMTVAPNTVLGKIKNQALKTFGYKSVLWLRQQVELDRNVLWLDMTTFIETWWELAQFYCPRAPRFLESDVNKGWRRNYRIINDTGDLCKDVLRAGMLTGMSSPTRQWFALAVSDESIMEQQDVKDWLYDVSQRMAAMFNRGNLYEELPLWYENGAVFGTGLVWMEESAKSTVRFRSLPIGSFAIHHDPEGDISTFYRSFMMTVQQLLDEFGERDKNGEITNWEHFSQAVRNAHDAHLEHYWFYVGHYIRPNKEYEPEAPGTQGMPFLEVYFENGQVNQTAPGVATTAVGSEQWRFLRVRGLEQMPLMELIWQRTGEDDYGTECPGIRAIGDVRQLQAQEKRVSQASEKMINPAMQGPMTLKGQRASILPGELTLYDQRQGDAGFKPVHEVNLPIDMMERRSTKIENRIKEEFFYDLFLMMQAVDQDKAEPITATEVVEKKEEKLLMLSPVLEKANRRGFAPLVKFAFRAMLKRGDVPEPPAALRGKPLIVEFTSIFAQALKLIELEKVEKFTGWLMGLLEAMPHALDLLDQDELVRMYADRVGLPGHILKDQKIVDAMRQAAAQAQAAQQKQAAMAQASQTMRNLSQSSTDPNDPNALTQMMQEAQSGGLVPGQ